ncbi:MAG TPA: hypothetical protein VNL18_01780 [Gemmatimonadales bacterium]|nr:hypothetical protein [Gemmatimonadales bacterium]
MTRTILLSAALALVSPGPMPASQDLAAVLVAEGVAAYHDLEFAAAARLLRRAVEGSTRPVVGSERKRALVYLGAAELFLDQREHAVSAFRELALDDPTFRPDSLIFPPRVTLLFEEVLQTTKGVAVSLPPEQSLTSRGPGLAITINATSPHLIETTLQTAEGAAVRRFYEGRIDGRIVLQWDGSDEAGRSVAAGHYQIEVASMINPGAVLRLVRVPLEVRVTRPDTSAWPLRPPRSSSSGIDLRFLLPGLAAGLALALPPLVGDMSAEGARVGLGGAVAGVGVALALRPRAMRGATEEWEQSVARTRAENARRRTMAAIVVRAGTPLRIEGAGK